MPTARAEARTGNAQAQNAPTAVQFVVDTSGSMFGTKLTQAKEALRAGIGALGETQVAGLRSYAGGCGNQGILRVAPAVGNRDAMRSAVDGLFASGGTPTPDALRGAAADLSGITGPRIVILISDGQSTCGNPCPVAASLKQQLGVDFKAFTIGFQAPSSAESELRCVADVTGGEYFSATDTEGITDAINDALAGGTFEYVAVGDSTTTGFSVPTCVENRVTSPFGCVGQPPATPYPERIAAADGRFAVLERKGIWGDTAVDAAAAFTAGQNAQGPWEPQITTAQRATELVTVSMGANDMQFSDVAHWLGECVGPNQKKFLGVTYDVSIGVTEDRCRTAARERVQDPVIAAAFTTMFDALDTAQDNGAAVVVTEYFNPFNAMKEIDFLPDRSCGLIHTISDIITDELNADLSRRAGAHGFTTVDFKEPFDGHGAGAKDSYVFGVDCEAFGALSGVNLDLDWGWPPVNSGDTSANIARQFDPHPNNKGTQAQATAILEALS
ncbi:hypothetical protein BH20ACT2_BH20ACT2_19120 [soil metagenome]